MRIDARKVAVASLMATTASAFSESEFLDLFAKKYSIADNSQLAEKSCGICHVSDEDFSMNPYGREIKKDMAAVGAKTLTEAILAKVEPLDSDGDGVPNLDEIRANTFPGDPKSGGKAGVTPPPEPSPEPKSAAPFPPKNGFHPAVVHFPIGLFIAGLALDSLGLLRRSRNLLFAGWYNLVLAAISGVAAAATGYLAMVLQKLPNSGLIKQHLVYAIASAVIMWLMVALRVHRHEKMNLPARAAYYLLAAAGLMLISYAGHLGGVFVYGE
jgi:uncharacterized membrane protein